MSTIAQTEPMCLMCEEYRRTADETLLNPIADRMQELGIDCLFVSKKPSDQTVLVMYRAGKRNTLDIYNAAWFDRYGKIDISCDQTFEVSQIVAYGDVQATWIRTEMLRFVQRREIWADGNFQQPTTVKIDSMRYLQTPIAVQTPSGVTFQPLAVVTCHKSNILHGLNGRLPGFLLPGLFTMPLGMIDFDIPCNIQFKSSAIFPDQVVDPRIDGLFVPYSDDHSQAEIVLDYIRSHPFVLSPQVVQNSAPPPRSWNSSRAHD